MLNALKGSRNRLVQRRRGANTLGEASKGLETGLTGMPLSGAFVMERRCRCYC